MGLLLVSSWLNGHDETKWWSKLVSNFKISFLERKYISKAKLFKMESGPHGHFYWNLETGNFPDFKIISFILYKEEKNEKKLFIILNPLGKNWYTNWTELFCRNFFFLGFEIQSYFLNLYFLKSLFLYSINPKGTKNLILMNFKKILKDMSWFLKTALTK